MRPDGLPWYLMERCTSQAILRQRARESLPHNEVETALPGVMADVMIHPRTMMIAENCPLAVCAFQQAD